MTIDQVHIELLKIAGGVIALLVMYWIRLIMLGKNR